MWIASIGDEQGKFTCKSKDVDGFHTQEEAIDWIYKTIRERGLKLIKLIVERTEISITENN